MCVSGRDRLSARLMVKLGRSALETKPQAADRSRIGRGDAPSLAPLWQPQLLVGIVAPPEVDLPGAILRQYALDHFHRQKRAERQAVEPPIMGELVDDGAPLPDDPEL